MPSNKPTISTAQWLGGPIARIKHGVALPPSVAIPIMHRTVCDVYAAFGYDTVITSGIDGMHGWSSEHFKGDALDYRIKHVPRDTWKEIADAVDVALNGTSGRGQFDVVLHDGDDGYAPHLHVEYDPKERI